MIDRMSKYSFVLLSSGKEEFLRDVQALGLVDITRSEKALDERSSRLLGSIAEQKKLIGEIEACSDDTLKLYRESLAALRKEEAAQSVWGSWDAGKLASTGISLHFYMTAAKLYDPLWEESWAIQKVAGDRQSVWFVIAGSNEGFPLKELPAPLRPLDELRKDIRDLQATLDRYAASLEARKAELPGLRDTLTATEEELGLAFASASAGTAAENTLTLFEGFAPQENDEALAAEFDKLPVVWFREKATVEDNPPIRLRNNRFVRMFEVITDMYGRPDYNEFDPTPYISIFFLLFFAMCMGDAGYGLVLAVLGIVLRRKEGLSDIAPLVTTLGIGTFAAGIVMHTFFGVDISALGWIPGWLKAVMITGTIGGFEAQMVIALGVGIVHLSLAMILKTIYATRNRGFLGSLGIWGWTLLIVGGVAVGAASLAGVIDGELTKWIIIALGILSGLGIFLLNDIHRNPLANIGAGLWETYNTVTGLLGDVLSYLRLYALGLAGSMLGKAFNDIASMPLGDGSSPVGWFAFLLIIIVGHALNIAMCCLGAFVHPLRLNFLEFFKNAGYDGKGRNYNPIKKTINNN
ncbi:MAG: ATPase V [Bacteroidales bacterium]|nr:ATPase V [Bacteroidales bacterium]